MNSKHPCWRIALFVSWAFVLSGLGEMLPAQPARPAARRAARPLAKTPSMSPAASGPKTFAAEKESLPSPRSQADTAAEEFVVASPRDVEDATLRRSDETWGDDEYWSDWNFGKSQILDVGYASSVWNQYRAVSLIRFRLDAVPCARAQFATLRIYKPRCVTQLHSPAPVSVYAVCSANAGWEEGTKECELDDRGASWNGLAGRRPWAGRPGCSQPNVDFESTALDVQLAARDEGRWLEFHLPGRLIQRWLDQPDTNAGLLVKIDYAELGDHVHFFSSEHDSGRGPQLVINGERGEPRAARNQEGRFNPRYVLPPQGRQFARYVSEDNSRYSRWIKDPRLNLDGKQKLYPYYWDIVVDGELILPKAYITLARNMAHVDALVAAKDEEGCRALMRSNQRCWHVWEYAKEQRWYESGSTLEILSPRQLALIHCRRDERESGLKGIISKYFDSAWRPAAMGDLEARIQGEMNRLIERLDLDEAQISRIQPVIRQQETLRMRYHDQMRRALDDLYELMKTGDDGPETVDALGRAMVYHDRMLFHDSFFGLPRAKAIIANADAVKYVAMWKAMKGGEYAPDRIRRRAETCIEFWPEGSECPLKELVNRIP